MNKKIIVVSIAFLVILSLTQFIVPNIIGFDGHHHIKTADIIKKEGFIKEFPWAKHTIFADNYADIHLLFRIILVPFTLLGLELGAKIASIIFGTSSPNQTTFGRNCPPFLHKSPRFKLIPLMG